MGRIILKCDRDTDRYLVWSSGVDDVVEWGTRKDMRDSLLRGYTLDRVMDELDYVLEEIEDTLRRCDETGSSSRLRVGKWEDQRMNHGDGFIFRTDMGAVFVSLDRQYRGIKIHKDLIQKEEQ